MKSKYFFVLIICILILSIVQNVSADCVEEFDENGVKLCTSENTQPFTSTRPYIKAFFYENPVTIFNYSLVYMDQKETKPLENLTSLSARMNFTFQPKPHLPNGKYTFFFKARDIDSNIIEYYYNFSISVNSVDVWVSEPNNAFVNKQKFAVGKNSTFDLVLELERPGNCGFRANREYVDINGNALDLNASTYENESSAFFVKIPGTKKVKISNFNFSKYFGTWGNENGENIDGNLATMHLLCMEDGGQRFSMKQIKIGVDKTPPVFTNLTNIPKIVVDASLRSTKIFTTLDDKSVCKFDVTDSHPQEDGVSLSRWTYDSYSNFSDFQFNTNETVSSLSAPEAYTYEFNVTCTNMAMLENSKTLLVEVNLQNLQEINFIYPYGWINNNSPTIKFTNTAGQECEYKINGGAIQTVDVDNNNLGPYEYYIQTQNLLDFENSVEVRCAGMGSFQEHTFRVDTKPPVTPTIKANLNTCGFSKIEATLTNKTDNVNGSGFDEFIYNITLAGDTNNEYTMSGSTSGSISKSISSFNKSAIDGKMFTITAWSVDNVGHISPAATHNIKVTNSNINECDFDNPKIVVDANKNNQTKHWNITVDCEDDTSGCKPQYFYSIHTNTSEECSYNLQHSLGETFVLTNSSTVCLAVYDNNNNNDTFIKQYTVTYPASCSNGFRDGDETGDDCGGSCPTCILNETCIENSDCTDGYCKSGKCALPSCTDKIKNGDETGVDCGGTDPLCAACPIGTGCAYDTDCLTLNCNLVSGKCEEPSCNNSKIDGDETDLNCGGLVCDACGDKKSCLNNADCGSDLKCYSNICSIDKELDTDNDGLPDWWELENFGCKTCADPDGDPDGDRWTNEEEYNGGVSSTNPNNPDSKPEGIKLNPVAIILLSLGLLCIIAGVVLLLLEQKKKEESNDSQMQSSFESSLSQGPRPVVLTKEENKLPERTFSDKEREIRERMKRKAAIQKSNKRRSLLDEFEVSEKSSEKPLPILTPMQKKELYENKKPELSIKKEVPKLSIDSKPVIKTQTTKTSSAPEIKKEVIKESTPIKSKEYIVAKQTINPSQSSSDKKIFELSISEQKNKKKSDKPISKKPVKPKSDEFEDLVTLAQGKEVKSKNKDSEEEVFDKLKSLTEKNKKKP